MFGMLKEVSPIWVVGTWTSPSPGFSYAGKCAWPVFVASHSVYTLLSIQRLKGSPWRFLETSSTWVPLFSSSISQIPATLASAGQSFPSYLSESTVLHLGCPFLGRSVNSTPPPQPQAKSWVYRRGHHFFFPFLSGIIVLHFLLCNVRKQLFRSIFSDCL